MANAEERITEVYFERVFNLGNYETMRMGLKATVAEKKADELLKYLSRYTMKVRDDMKETL
jgi:hypothetical protein